MGFQSWTKSGGQEKWQQKEVNSKKLHLHLPGPHKEMEELSPVAY